MPEIGETISHYRIVEKIGQGGMGEVYQAKDTKLGRSVAIKVLPEEFAKDADRVARFQREAKLLASLNHPNIAAIHGLEEVDGTNFLVMELVEGQTLDDRIKSGSIPVEEALKLALQIAEALEAAHEKGVIHRDLKPANIKVTPDGKVKVLDFGLAKAFAGEQADLNLSNSPTLSVASTQQGVILGTAAYMSPEQARGKEVDKRADIWAFGVVLFEMLTGKSLFSGEDVSSTLARVLEREPDFSTLPQNLHPRILLLLERCLKKESKNRYSGISDARVDIKEVLDDPSGVFLHPITAAAPQNKLRIILPWVAVAIVVAGVVGWLLNLFLLHEPEKVIRFAHILPESQNLTDARCLALSPDGTKLVYATTQGLYLRKLDELVAKRIPGTEEEVYDPFFSPDSRWIGYFSTSKRKLKKIPVTGGSPKELCEIEGTNINAAWEVGDTIVFDQYGGALMRISADGGKPEAIFDPEDERVFNPRILPDGKSVMYTGGMGSKHEIVVRSLESGDRTVLFPGQSAEYLAEGYLVYFLDGDLYAVGFDPEDLEKTGEPVSIAQDVYAQGTAHYSVSDSGLLAYLKGEEVFGSASLVWVDREGKEETIDAPVHAYSFARLSPDGTRVALDIWDQENFRHDIWIWEFTGKLSHFSLNPGSNMNPVWTPDGTKLTFMNNTGEKINIYSQSIDGSGSPELLIKGLGEPNLPMAFSPDMTKLLTVENNLPNQINILELGDSTALKRLFSSINSETNPQISPGGRWLAYQSNELWKDEIYVRPFPNVYDEQPRQVSTEGGMQPLWNPDGSELFYYSPKGAMMVVPVKTDPTFEWETPKELFRNQYPSAALDAGHRYSYDPDGQRFLMINDITVIGGATPQINIVTNWFEELKEKAPVE